MEAKSTMFKTKQGLHWKFTQSVELLLHIGQKLCRF